jgi:hypothetical protein
MSDIDPSPPDVESAIPEDLSTSVVPSCSPLFETTLPPEVLPSDPISNDDQPTAPSEADISELDSAIEALLVNSILPSPELRPQIAQILETRRVDAIMAGDYDKAEEQDRVSQLLQNAVQAAEQKRSEDLSINRLYDRWQQLQREQQEISERWDAKMREVSAKYEEERTQLEAQQAQEIEFFIGKWKDPAFLRPFTKPTPKLLQLREQERHMGLSRRYGEAKETRAVADRLQREETQAAQARINVQMTAERQKLAGKHDRDLKALATKKNQTIKSLKERKQRELRPVVTAIQQIRAKKVAPSRHPSSLPELQARPESASACGQENLCSPRTAARYSMFRAEKKTALLEVAPIDDQTISQLRRQPTSRARSGAAGRRS